MREISWKRTTEKIYDYALGVVPPEVMAGGDFLLGEPQSHRRCSVGLEITPVFDGYAQRGDKFYATSEPVSAAEFVAARQKLDEAIAKENPEAGSPRQALEKLVSQAVKAHTPEELALGWLRYERVRKFNAKEFGDIYRESLQGQFFDKLITEKILA